MLSSYCLIEVGTQTVFGKPAVSQFADRGGRHRGKPGTRGALLARNSPELRHMFWRRAATEGEAVVLAQLPVALGHR